MSPRFYFTKNEVLSFNWKRDFTVFSFWFVWENIFKNPTERIFITIFYFQWKWKQKTIKPNTLIFYIFCEMNFIKYRMAFLPLFNKGLKLVKESLFVRVCGRLFFCGQVRRGRDWEELRSCLRLYFWCVYCLRWCRTLAGSYLFSLHFHFLKIVFIFKRLEFWKHVWLDFLFSVFMK